MCATITHVNALRFHGNTPRPRALLHTTTLPHDFFAIRRLFPTPTRGIKKPPHQRENETEKARELYTNTLSLSVARAFEVKSSMHLLRDSILYPPPPNNINHHQPPPTERKRGSDCVVLRYARSLTVFPFARTLLCCVCSGISRISVL